MKKSIIKLAIVSLALTASVCWAAEGTKDREKIIDVSALTQAMQKATGPFSERLRSSQLDKRFSGVMEILKQGEFDKEELVGALKALDDELDYFTKDWEQAVKPLWDGQEAISQTIDKVRTVLANGKAGAMGENVKARIQKYDKRLQVLAQTIEAEKDPERKERLKMIFKNVLALRGLTERFGRVNLGPANEALQVKIVRALSSLQDQLTIATFEVEKSRVVLVSMREFVSDYVDVLEGMVEAEELAKTLAGMKGAGQDISGMVTGVGDLTKKAEELAGMLNGFAESLADSIETETAHLAEQIAQPEGFEDIDVEKEIRKYAKGKNTKVR